MLPRRALAAIATTAMALALLLNFKTPSAPLGTTSVVVGQPVTGSTVGVNGQSSSASTPPVAASTGPSAASAPPSGSSASAASGSSGSGSSSTGQSASATLKSGTFTGSTVQIPFGNVQVQVTIKGGKITDVQPLQMPTAHARSQMISQYVAPMLLQEVLQVQTAQINLVSGATYTSEAYAQSLQAALDQAVA